MYAVLQQRRPALHGARRPAGPAAQGRRQVQDPSVLHPQRQFLQDLRPGPQGHHGVALRRAASAPGGRHEQPVEEARAEAAAPQHPVVERGSVRDQRRPAGPEPGLRRLHDERSQRPAVHRDRVQPGLRAGGGPDEHAAAADRVPVLERVRAGRGAVRRRLRGGVRGRHAAALRAGAGGGPGGGGAVAGVPGEHERHRAGAAAVLPGAAGGDHGAEAADPPDEAQHGGPEAVPEPAAQDRPGAAEREVARADLGPAVAPGQAEDGPRELGHPVEAADREQREALRAVAEGAQPAVRQALHLHEGRAGEAARQEARGREPARRTEAARRAGEPAPARGAPPAPPGRGRPCRRAARRPPRPERGRREHDHPLLQRGREPHVPGPPRHGDRVHGPPGAEGGRDRADPPAAQADQDAVRRARGPADPAAAAEHHQAAGDQGAVQRGGQHQEGDPAGQGRDPAARHHDQPARAAHSGAGTEDQGAEQDPVHPAVQDPRAQADHRAEGGAAGRPAEQDRGDEQGAAELPAVAGGAPEQQEGHPEQDQVTAGADRRPGNGGADVPGQARGGADAHQRADRAGGGPGGGARGGDAARGAALGAAAAGRPAHGVGAGADDAGAAVRGPQHPVPAPGGAAAGGAGLPDRPAEPRARGAAAAGRGGGLQQAGAERGEAAAEGGAAAAGAAVERGRRDGPERGAAAGDQPAAPGAAPGHGAGQRQLPHRQRAAAGVRGERGADPAAAGGGAGPGPAGAGGRLPAGPAVSEVTASGPARPGSRTARATAPPASRAAGRPAARPPRRSPSASGPCPAPGRRSATRSPRPPPS